MFRGIVIALAIVSTIVTIGYCHNKSVEDERTAKAVSTPRPTPPPAPEPTPPTSMPVTHFDVSAVMGKSRAAVQKIMGKPTDEGTAGDTYALGELRITLRYLRGERVTEIVLRANQGTVLDENTTLTWMHLAPADMQPRINGRPVDVSWQQIYGMFGVDVIDDEYKKAQDAKDAREKAKADEEEERQRRKVYAQTLDEALLSDGVEALVTTSGPADTTLHIQSGLCGRVLIHKIMTAGDDGEGQKYAGFSSLGWRRIECSDGFQVWSESR